MTNWKYSLAIIVIALASCQKDDLAAKKTLLAKKSSQLTDLQVEIEQLETDIMELDSTFKDGAGAILVSMIEVAPTHFEHKIEIRGQVASRKNVTVSAETMGRVLAVNVKEGATVRAGQTLLRLDAEILENNIAELETSLDLATTVYEKQARLWDKQIGTEVQYLQAKNSKESLERRLATARSQRNQAYVKAPFSGVVDLVNIKQGEMATAGMPLIRIVNMGEMHIVADVPERYLTGVKAGDSVDVFFSSLDREMASKVTAVGQVINPLNRTFTVEVDLPSNDRDYKPNMIAVLKVKDYESPQALIVPSGIIQKDNIGDYLYKVTNNENTMEAHKVHITLGKTYGGTTEIIEGLASGDKLVNEGYREVTDGVKVSKAEKTTL